MMGSSGHIDRAVGYKSRLSEALQEGRVSKNECFHQQPRKPCRGTRKGESKSNTTAPFLPQPHQFCGKSFLDQGLEHTLGGSIIQKKQAAST